MKKLFAMALALLMALSLAACGGGTRKNYNSIPSWLGQSQSEASDTGTDKSSEPTNNENADVKQEEGEANSENAEEPEAASSSDGVTPEFKEAMDSYEAFFDEYAEFMKKYNESDNPAAMLGDYASMMTRYAETMEKLDEIDEDGLSTADALYYTEVMVRINQKLMSVL